MDGDSFFCGFALTEFLLDGSDLCALKRLLENFLDKAGYDTALESEEFADVVAEMFQVFFCQMVASKIYRCERRHLVDGPYLCVVMKFLQLVGIKIWLHHVGDVSAEKLNLCHAEFHILLFEFLMGCIAQFMLREKFHLEF